VLWLVEELALEVVAPEELDERVSSVLLESALLELAAGAVDDTIVLEVELLGERAK
jgi:hypothetical protein